MALNSSSGLGYWIAGGAFVVVAGVAGYFLAPRADDAVVEKTAVVQEATPVVQKAGVPKETDPTQVKLPVINTLRVDKEGGVVFAGVAEPNGEIVARISKEEVARIKADQGGRFAGLFQLARLDEAQFMEVSMAFEGRVYRAEETIMIAPVKPKTTESASVAEETVAQSAEVAEKDEPEKDVAEAQVTQATAAVEQTESETSLAASSEEVVSETVTQHETKETEGKTVEAVENVVKEIVETTTAQIEDKVEDKAEGVKVAVLDKVREAVETSTVNNVAEPDVKVEASTPAVVKDPVIKAQEPKIAEGTEAASKTVTAGSETTSTANSVEEDTAQAKTSQPAQDKAQPETSSEAQTATADPEPAAPVVIKSGPSGVKVLQAASTLANEIAANIALNSISYSDSGAVELSGRGKGEAFVRVYLDNTPVESASVTQTGEWQVNLPNVDTGIYTLRIDEVDASGAVTSRIETPFKREDKEILASVTKTSDMKNEIEAITVQAGFTLWAIARDRYGEGTEYVKVFNANRDQIRDPDLIYPGQVFSLPSQ
jgi:hypothetical protein